MSPTPTDPALTLDAKYTRLEGDVFMTGVQALVRLPLDQMRRDRRDEMHTAMLVTGYQGSPLGGFDLELQRRGPLLDEHNIHHVPALNEELAATAVLGSQQASSLSGARYDGVAALWYGKAPGLDRATDAIRHGNMIGVDRRGGALVAVGDDALSKSSTLPSSSEATFFDLLVPFLAPADPQEVLDLGLHAISLSRASGLWAGMKISTNVADGSGTVILDPERVQPAMPQMELDGQPYRHRVDSRLVAPVPLDLERTLHQARLEAARRYGVLNHLNRTQFAAAGDRVGIVAAGKTYLELRDALARMGLSEEALESSPVRLLKVSMPFPLDSGIVREFAAGLEEVIVVEDKRAILELLIKEALYDSAAPPRVVGKRDEHGAPLITAEKEVDADVALAALAPRLSLYCELRAPGPPVELPVVSASRAPAAAPRPPWFCSGCPHSTSTKVPEGTLVGGGIGCHALVLLMSPEQVGEVVGVTQMGGEGAQWIGMAPFVSTEHFVQNIGDGTFLHSGSLALRAAVAAGVDVTYKILWNSAVAMTGGQHAVGAPDVPRLTRLLEDEGVARTIVTTDERSRYRRLKLASNAVVWDRARVVEAQEALAKVPGVTVLVHDQECAAERRRKRKRGKAPEPPQRVFVNERVCEGCGDCGAKSNCLSVQPIETEFGEKTRIHQASCNKDFTCLQGDCPSFMTVVPGAKRTRKPAPTLEPGDLSEPPIAAAPATIRIVGMGGTGVVTVAQVLGTAAFIDGLAVRGLDQTGMAQKGGPVVSDLRLFPQATEASNKSARAECDLYLGCDVLVAADERYLSAAAPGRTTAVIATTEVPTGPMVSDPAKHFPPLPALHERIDAATGSQGNAYLDPRAITTALFGSDRAANVLLLGVASQLGKLPISAAAIEQAIELNGASVAENVQAFRRGRQWVLDRAALEAALDTGPAGPVERAIDPALEKLIAVAGASAGGELERLLRVRAPELARYQSRRYAESYVELVARARAVEEERVGSTELSEAVAANLFKLMAYKDEYEVARLHLDPSLRDAIQSEFGEGARVYWHLHPPLLRTLGLKRKLRLGGWFAGPYRVLRGMRRLRGTPLDPFGRAEVRRVERQLIGEYREMVAGLLDRLSPQSHAESVEIASLPEMIRGYEEIKLDNVKRYRERLAVLAPPPTRDLEENPI